MNTVLLRIPCSLCLPSFRVLSFLTLVCFLPSLSYSAFITPAPPPFVKALFFFFFLVTYCVQCLDLRMPQTLWNSSCIKGVHSLEWDRSVLFFFNLFVSVYFFTILKKNHGHSYCGTTHHYLYSVFAWHLL